MSDNNPGQGHKDETVTVKITDIDYPISKGEHTVVELKDLGHVPLAYDLNQIIEKKPHLLPDDGKTNIHGGEVFVGSPKGSGSSND